MTADPHIDGRIDFYGTYAALVAAFPAPTFPNGSSAQTTDLGAVTWNGSQWVMNRVQTVAANSGGAQAGATPLTGQVNNVTVGGGGYSVALPVSAPGHIVTVINADAANSLNVFPNAGGTTTEKINVLAANGAFALTAGKSVDFVCGVAGLWRTNPLVP